MAGEIVAVDVPERVKTALSLRAQGKSWRAVAVAMGEPDHAHLYHECRAFDAAMKGDPRWLTLTSNALDGALEATAQLNEKLIAREEKLSAPQLAVIAGIMTDKVVAMRRAEQVQAGGGAGDLVAQVLGALQAAGGGSVTLEVEVSAAKAEGRVIEVEAK